MFTIFIPVAIFLFLPIRMVIGGETKGFIRSCGIIHWAVMLTVFSLSHISILYSLPINEQAGSVGVLLYLLLLTQFNDISQYLWGKSCGKRKILPKISPNKTWEGFLGGILNVCVVSLIVGPLITPLGSLESLGSGLIIGIGGFFGDVVLSAIKRDLEIKDCGKLLPGHGGLLDRLDSLTFTAPLFFHYLYYLHF